jgi:hypothetical protein
MRVHEIMSRPAVTCGARDSAERAAQLMWENDCGASRHRGRGAHRRCGDGPGPLHGRLHEGRSAQRNPRRGRDGAPCPFLPARTRSLEECERLMSEKQIRRVPVVDSQKPPGRHGLPERHRTPVASSQKPDGREHLATCWRRSASRGDKGV